MSDDEVDLELLDLLRQHLGTKANGSQAAEDTGVLSSAHFVCDNSLDVALDMVGTRRAARDIWAQMQERNYSSATWSQHELHPKSKDEDTVNFIFTMDLLNFSFWSAEPTEKRFAIAYGGKRYEGYWSLVAALQRALEAGIPITSPSFWHNPTECTDDVLKDVFRSSTDEAMPLLEQRIAILREAAEVLCKEFDMSVVNLINAGERSAARLVNILADYFPSFRDEVKFEGRKVRFLKRAQIFVADLWACFEGQSFGEFHEIAAITMFADYRIPQILHAMNCLVYSPPLEAMLKRGESLPLAGAYEIEIRGCTIWAVEMIRREILKEHPESEINAILLDFFLYDRMKELERDGAAVLPHHRTRSIWY